MGDHFFVIEEGMIECGFEKKNPDGTIAFEHVRTLKQGDHFGEIALINNVRRTLSVKAASIPTQLMSLNRSTFTRVLGSIKSLLNEDYTKSSDNGGNTVHVNHENVDGSFITENSRGSMQGDNSFMSG